MPHQPYCFRRPCLITFSEVIAMQLKYIFQTRYLYLQLYLVLLQYLQLHLITFTLFDPKSGMKIYKCCDDLALCVCILQLHCCFTVPNYSSLLLLRWQDCLCKQGGGLLLLANMNIQWKRFRVVLLRRIYMYIHMYQQFQLVRSFQNTINMVLWPTICDNAIHLKLSLNHMKFIDDSMAVNDEITVYKAI